MSSGKDIKIEPLKGLATDDQSIFHTAKIVGQKVSVADGIEQPVGLEQAESLAGRRHLEMWKDLAPTIEPAGAGRKSVLVSFENYMALAGEAVPEEINPSAWTDSDKRQVPGNWEWKDGDFDKQWEDKVFTYVTVIEDGKMSTGASISKPVPIHPDTMHNLQDSIKKHQQTVTYGSLREADMKAMATDDSVTRILNHPLTYWGDMQPNSPFSTAAKEILDGQLQPDHDTVRVAQLKDGAQTAPMNLRPHEPPAEHFIG